MFLGKNVMSVCVKELDLTLKIDRFNYIMELFIILRSKIRPDTLKIYKTTSMMNAV